MIVFLFVTFLSFSTASDSQFDIHIVEDDRCVVRLIQGRNHSQMIYQAFDFNKFEWSTNDRGKKQGHLKSSLAFVRDVNMTFNNNGRNTTLERPRLVAYCHFDAEIPGVTTNENIPDLLGANVANNNNPGIGSCGVVPWTMVGLGAAVIANVVCIFILSAVILYYRRQVKEFKSQEIPDHIISRPPLALPSEVQYDDVYSHRGNRFLSKPRIQHCKLCACNKVAPIQ